MLRTLCPTTTPPIDLDPTNLTAYCEKLGTLIDQGDFREFNTVKLEIYGHLQSHRPRTAEDYVAKGFAKMYSLNTRDSVDLIAQGRAMRDSPDAEFKHAVALAGKGFKERDLELLEQARTELSRVEARYGSNNRIVMHGTVSIARYIALVSRSQGVEVDANLLTLADDRVTKLYSEKVPFTLVNCAWYLDHVRHDLDGAERYWRKACELSSGDLYHSPILCILA